MTDKWEGPWVAVVTPFRKGKVDLVALKSLVERQVRAGISGIIPCGTTGEGSALTTEEFESVVTTVMSAVQGKIPVVPGTGSNQTLKTVEMTRKVKELGADGAMIVAPYYVKATQEGIYRHFMEVGAVGLPLMLYNIPARTACDVQAATIDRIAKGAPLRAVKDCAPLPHSAEILRRTKGQVAVFTGEDGVYLPFMSLGGAGIVSVTANVAPTKIVEIYRAAKDGDWDRARKVFFSLLRLNEALFMESSPIPVKKALAMMNLIEDEIRSPLSLMEPGHAEELRGVLREAQLL